MNGVIGIKITSKSNGNSVFLPTAGYRSYDELYNAGSEGHYWSSSLYPSLDNYAQYLSFYSSYLNWDNYDYRCFGRSVRAVRL